VATVPSVDDDRDELKALGETVKRLRIEHGAGPRGLAFDAEIDEDTLISLEEGKTEPRWGRFGESPERSMSSFRRS